MSDTECKYFYLCARKPGYCGHEGECQSEDCHHTVKEEKAKNHVGRKFVLIETAMGAERWEYETEEEFKELQKIKHDLEKVGGIGAENEEVNPFGMVGWKKDD